MSTSRTVTDILVESIADRVVERLLPLLTEGKTAEHSLISIENAAQRMDVTHKAFRHLIANGTIPEKMIRRFGRRIFIDRGLFNQWLEAR